MMQVWSKAGVSSKAIFISHEPSCGCCFAIQIDVPRFYDIYYDIYDIICDMYDIINKMLYVSVKRV